MSNTKIKAGVMQGEFIDTGTPDAVITDANLEKVYNIKVRVITVNAGVERKVCVPVGERSQATEAKTLFVREAP
jgi:ABC-type cobalamin/Fe3+-siderophores transport system ATPase subunit